MSALGGRAARDACSPPSARVAIVNRPSSFIDLPCGPAPPSGDSIGLWTYQVATCLAKRWDVIAYTPEDRVLARPRTHHAGVELVGVPPCASSAV